VKKSEESKKIFRFALFRFTAKITESSEAKNLKRKKVKKSEKSKKK
jgi:hypothetical protein